MLKKPQVTMVASEFLGTGLLVLVALALTQVTNVSYFVGTSVAAALAVIYMLFSSISGAHVNPALTFGMWTARQISTLRAISYIAAQFLGALAALELYQYLSNHTLPAKNLAFSTPMWLAEVIGTAILAMGLTAAITRGMDSLQSALTYSFSFFIGILVAATASAALLNPAIALGSRNWNSVYVLGPLVGGLVGVNLYMWLFAPAKARPSRKRK